MIKMVHLAPCSINIPDKEAALLFLGHVYQLHRMLESIVSHRDLHFTSKFWYYVLKILGSKLRVSTANHRQIDGQTEQADRVMAV